MNRQLKRILDLVRRTGDRMVITDPNGDDAYVIMGLDQYEELLTGESTKDFDDEDGEETNWSPEMYGDLIPTEPLAETGEELGKTLGRQATQSVKEDLPENLREAVEHDLEILENWQKENQSPTAKPTESKVIENQPKNDDDEDRFYLEPIE